MAGTRRLAVHRQLVGNHRGWFWPLALVLIGTFMLLRDLDVIDRDFAIWPIAIVAFGLAILLEAFGGNGSKSNPATTGVPPEP